MPTKNLEYLRDRANVERVMCLAAIHPKAMAAHRELAERYDALTSESEKEADVSLA